MNSIVAMKTDLRYFDAHGHLNDPRFDEDRDAVLSRMRAASVAAISVGTDKEMSARAVALAEAEPDIWATIGQHPTDKHEEVFDEVWYREQAKHPRVVAIGECGLDYYWPAFARGRAMAGEALDEKNDSFFRRGEEAEKQRQRDLFAKQIALAKDVGKPLMVHGRPTKGTMDAYDDILATLDEEKFGGERAGDIHFFVGSTDIARKFLDRGFTLSFTGVLTFTHDYDEVVRFVPLDRILAETDAPYVAPVPHRGKRNESAYVPEVVKAVARIRGVPEDEVAPIIKTNADRLFGVIPNS